MNRTANKNSGAAWGGTPPYAPHRRGPPRVPPSGGPRVSPRPARTPDPAWTPTGRTPKVQNVFRFKLDAKSVPEALAASVRILLRFSIDLAHR